MEKLKIGLTIIFLLLITTGTSRAGVDWDITAGHEIIENGDTFDKVTIYNSTIVDMTGGEVNILRPYSNASVNVSGGHVGLLYVNGSSTVNLTNGLIDSITVGLNVSDDASITIDCDLNTLEYTYDQGVMIGVAGNWNDTTPFDIQIDNFGYSPTSDYMVFVPEPISIALLSFGGLLLRIRRF